MSLDLDWDDAQHAVASAVESYARDRWDDDAVKALEGRFPDALWRDLAGLGVLAIATPDGDGGAMEAVAALEALGRRGLPGPLADTLVASQLLPEESGALGRGERIAGIAADDLVPWPDRCDVLLRFDPTGPRQVRTASPVETLETLGGEMWGRATLGPVATLDADRCARALALGEIALASLLAAAGGELVGRAADHARARTQFGRPVGEFQAVAHPLADAHMRIEAATVLTRFAAFAFDSGTDDAAPRASAARASARDAALEAAHTAHQVFGAVGVTLEGPVFHLSRRIRQWASHPLPSGRSPHEVFEWVAGGPLEVGR